MNINVDKNILLKSITIAESIISSKNINTILSNCLFSVSNDEVEIISTDNDIAVRTKINVISDANGSFITNGKKFSSILKELPNDELVVNVNDSLLIDIKTKAKNIKGHYTLVGINSEEYPDIPVFNMQDSIIIDQQLLKEIIKKVIYAASVDSIKPVFNSVYFVSDAKGKFIAVATDSRRLSVISRSLESEIDFKDGVIIPLKTIHEVYKLLESTGTCIFSIKDNQCFFKIGNTEIISRVVEGQFPNFNQVIPKEHKIEAVIETKRLLESVRRAMIFSREPANKIVLTFGKDNLHIEASTPELGEAEEDLPIETNSNESISLGINAQFLVDTLREVDSNTIKCGITGHMSPVTIMPEDDSNYTSVIMPIQIKSSDE